MGPQKRFRSLDLVVRPPKCLLIWGYEKNVFLIQNMYFFYWPGYACIKLIVFIFAVIPLPFSIC